MANISTNAQACENAVSTKAFARRDPYPPAKSDAPQRNTAITLYAAGANWVSEDTPDEGTTAFSFDLCGDDLCGDNRLGCPGERSSPSFQ